MGRRRAGSRAVFTSLQSVLQELQTTPPGNPALPLYRPTGCRNSYFVLSDSTDGVGAVIGDEPLTSNRPLDLHQASSVSGAGVDVKPCREFRLTFDSAVSLPWEDGFGRGVVLIGVQDPHVALLSTPQRAARRTLAFGASDIAAELSEEEAYLPGGVALGAPACRLR